MLQTPLKLLSPKRCRSPVPATWNRLKDDDVFVPPISVSDDDDDEGDDKGRTMATMGKLTSSTVGPLPFSDILAEDFGLDQKPSQCDNSKRKGLVSRTASDRDVYGAKQHSTTQPKRKTTTRSGSPPSKTGNGEGRASNAKKGTATNGKKAQRSKSYDMTVTTSTAETGGGSSRGSRSHSPVRKVYSARDLFNDSVTEKSDNNKLKRNKSMRRAKSADTTTAASDGFSSSPKPRAKKVVSARDLFTGSTTQGRTEKGGSSSSSHRRKKFSRSKSEDMSTINRGCGEDKMQTQKGRKVKSSSLQKALSASNVVKNNSSSSSKRPTKSDQSSSLQKALSASNVVKPDFRRSKSHESSKERANNKRSNFPPLGRSNSHESIVRKNGTNNGSSRPAFGRSNSHKSIIRKDRAGNGSIRPAFGRSNSHESIIRKGANTNSVGRPVFGRSNSHESVVRKTPASSSRPAFRRSKSQESVTMARNPKQQQQQQRLPKSKKSSPGGPAFGRSITHEGMIGRRPRTPPDSSAMGSSHNNNSLRKAPSSRNMDGSSGSAAGRRGGANMRKSRSERVMAQRPTTTARSLSARNMMRDGSNSGGEGEVAGVGTGGGLVMSGGRIRLQRSTSTRLSRSPCRSRISTRQSNAIAGAQLKQLHNHLEVEKKREVAIARIQSNFCTGLSNFNTSASNLNLNNSSTNLNTNSDKPGESKPTKAKPTKARDLDDSSKKDKVDNRKNEDMRTSATDKAKSKSTPKAPKSPKKPNKKKVGESRTAATKEDAVKASVEAVTAALAAQNRDKSRRGRSRLSEMTAKVFSSVTKVSGPCLYSTPQPQQPAPNTKAIAGTPSAQFESLPPSSRPAFTRTLSADSTGSLAYVFSRSATTAADANGSNADLASLESSFNKVVAGQSLTMSMHR